ncbi:MAG TPA: sulfotransferase [Elusimicrobiota bacterium]|nr:sulfotransferase [Elusimicrobiota bacterium]
MMAASFQPTFLVIGAAKCGSGYIHEVLCRHPEIAMGQREIHFFSSDKRYKKGWDWYLRQFPDVRGKKAIGEVSHSLSDVKAYPEAVPRILKHVPDARFIYLVRHPLERIESTWMQLRVNPGERDRPVPPFNRAVREVRSLVSASLYWFQISAYRRHFPDDRILVLFLEDIKADPGAALRRCFRFLGVAETVDSAAAAKPVNAAVGKYRDGDFLARARFSLPFRLLRPCVPDFFCRPFYPLIKEKITARPAWDPEVRRWAIEQLREDMRQFLAHYDKPADFWPLIP